MNVDFQLFSIKLVVETWKKNAKPRRWSIILNSFRTLKKIISISIHASHSGKLSAIFNALDSSGEKPKKVNESKVSNELKFACLFRKISISNENHKDLSRHSQSHKYTTMCIVKYVPVAVWFGVFNHIVN